MKKNASGGANKKRATINDVARLAKVSIKTVSRVFNHEPHVRPATSDRVLQAAKYLNYKPNLSARQLASNQRFVIGMVYDNPNAEYVTEVQSGSLAVCRKHQYNLLIHPCQSKSKYLVDEIIALDTQVDGLILLQPISDNRELCEQLLEKDIHCVRVSQRPFEGMPWISLGDFEAAYEMTQHLIELGHKRIAFIVGHPDHGQSHDRLEGYLQALKDHGIDKNTAYIEQGYFNFESGSEAAQKLFKVDPRPTAIFASNDPMALGVLSAAHQAGLSVPGDLSVAGYDDSPLARYTYPSLTTVKQPTEVLAESATELLMQEINGKQDLNHAKRLKAELVRRDSTTEPRQ